MSIEKLKRVCWRMRTIKAQRNPLNFESKNVTYSRCELERAIMLECGTSPLTYRNNRVALEKLQWVVRRGRRFKLTDRDLTEEV